MADITQILAAVEAGDRQAAAALLPLVYDELRKLAAARMVAESPGHTLDATTLVHEAYLRHGGGRHRVELTEVAAAALPEDLLALDEALTRLVERDSVKAEVVKLRYFAGMTVPEVAVCLGLSVATVERHWAFARAWLYSELNDEP